MTRKSSFNSIRVITGCVKGGLGLFRIWTILFRTSPDCLTSLGLAGGRKIHRGPSEWQLWARWSRPASRFIAPRNYKISFH